MLGSVVLGVGLAAALHTTANPICLGPVDKKAAAMPHCPVTANGHPVLDPFLGQRGAVVVSTKGFLQLQRCLLRPLVLLLLTGEDGTYETPSAQCCRLADAQTAAACCYAALRFGSPDSILHSRRCTQNSQRVYHALTTILPGNPPLRIPYVSPLCLLRSRIHPLQVHCGSLHV